MSSKLQHKAKKLSARNRVRAFFTEPVPMALDTLERVNHFKSIYRDDEIALLPEQPVMWVPIKPDDKEAIDRIVKLRLDTHLKTEYADSHTFKVDQLLEVKEIEDCVNAIGYFSEGERVAFNRAIGTYREAIESVGKKESEMPAPLIKSKKSNVSAVEIATNLRAMFGGLSQFDTAISAIKKLAIKDGQFISPKARTVVTLYTVLRDRNYIRSKIAVTPFALALGAYFNDPVNDNVGKRGKVTLPKLTHSLEGLLPKV